MSNLVYLFYSLGSLCFLAGTVLSWYLANSGGGK